ncbi:MAG: group 1 truncated hemoglobin [Kofleriaceae bacterium]|nr:group 1 truncated hemoglobin [Kofleriaceae bacterium]
MSTLYERVGGEPAIMAAVGILYEKLVADDLTRPFFDGMELDALLKKQIAFMARALGGPAEYRGRDLRAAHKDLVATRGLTDAHFDAVASHLAATLRELEVEEALVSEVLGVIGLTRVEVLDR